jgi:hypothetical protein
MLFVVDIVVKTSPVILFYSRENQLANNFINITAFADDTNMQKQRIIP